MLSSAKLADFWEIFFNNEEEIYITNILFKKNQICKIGDLGVVELDSLFIFAKKFLKNLLTWRRSSILKIIQTIFSQNPELVISGKTTYIRVKNWRKNSFFESSIHVIINPVDLSSLKMSRNLKKSSINRNNEV